MTPERWEQIERVFHAALARDVQDRAAFLAEACAGDAALRQEVASLLGQEQPAAGFLDAPAFDAAARTLAAADEPPARTLSPGARLGPYEILALAGAGGMGEVYKARDTRLGRTVAIKVLPTGVATDPDRLRRFEREARAVSALNHPHICTLYDIGSAPLTGRPLHYLVMEFLEGQTLAERLTKGPLPVTQALALGAEIADALGSAHRQGIIHRDLKPGNVMLTKTGAKLLDFGLAKLKRPVVSPGAASSDTRSQGSNATRKGTILGTLSYMAPEQLNGQDADARSDIFALGAVLYEMLTGTRAFDGESQASIIAAILDRDPAPLSALPSPAAPALERLVKRCLQKSPDNRWDSAADVADELRWIAQSSASPSQVHPNALVPPSRRWRWVVGVGALSAVLLSGIVLGWLARSRTPTTGMAVTRTLVDVRPAEELNAGGYSSSTPVLIPGGSRTALALSPDGRALAFIGRRAGVQQIYIRMLDRNEARPLAGTTDAQNPVFSADGQWVAYWAAGALWKAPVNGDPAVPLCRGVTQPPYGITWGTTGRLIYSADRVLWQVPAGGGTAEQITKTTPEEPNHILPHLLPGDTTVLYTVRKNQSHWGEDQLVAQSLVTGERKQMIRDASDARYVASGHLVFLRRGVLQAVPFDLNRVAVAGSPVGVLNRVAQAVYSWATQDMTGAGQFSVASTGTLAYISGDIAQPDPKKSIVELDRKGQVTTTPAPPRLYAGYVRVAPDGSRFAIVARSSSEDLGLWIYDTVRHTLSRHPASGEIQYWAVWSPDGQRLAAGRRRDGRGELFWQNADGSGSEHVLVSSDALLMPASWSPDGRHLVYSVDEQDIWIVDPDDPNPTPRALI
ncbi:MAG: protein kinase, partial [Acidobacteria bacterium]|nr:protein kinase [Acidobacteriota bacterium]